MMTERFNRKKAISAGMLLLLFLFACGSLNRAGAAILSQESATQDTIEIRWNDPDIPPGTTVDSFEIRLKKSSASSDDFKTAATLGGTQTGYTIGNLASGTRYTIELIYTYIDQYGNFVEGSEILKGARTLPGKVTGLKQDKWWYLAKKFHAVWEEQDGADGYEWICYGPNGEVKYYGTIDSDSPARVGVGKIDNGKIYTCRVRAFATVCGTKTYGEWSDATYFFAQPRITKVKVRGKKLKVSWKKLDGATGYYVYVSTQKTRNYKKAAEVPAGRTSLTIRKFGSKAFKAKKTYYVYVEAFMKVDGVEYRSGRLYYWNTKTAGKYGYF